MDDLPRENARQLIELIPLAMQAMRQGMRGGHGAALSVPQFRALALVERLPGASLGDAAAHVGLGAPAMSVIIEGLVRRGLVTRNADPADRRRSVLLLTAKGRAILARAHASTRRSLAARLASLDRPGHETLAAALRLLKPLFPAPSKDNP